MQRLEKMTIKRIDNQGDRVLLYSTVEPSPRGDYYIIAPKDCTVAIGETITYEPYGVNFGWLVSVSETVNHDGH